MIKRKFSTVMYLLAISFCIIFSVNLAHSYSGAMFTAMKAEPAPIIDGSVEPGEWGEGIFLCKSITTPGASNYNGVGNTYQADLITDDDDVNGTIYCLWDDNNLYLAVEVTDDDLFFEKGSGWDNDCVEIRFVPAGITGLWITPSLASAGPGWYWNNAVNGATATEETPLINATIGADGYEWEAAIPLTHDAIVGVDPAAGRTIGYTVSIGENDNGGADYAMSAWSLNPAAWGWDTEFFGEITFSADVLAAVSPGGKVTSAWGAIKSR
ncbi:sugar-binding protein [Candidatus Poribacteria bacterium]